MALTSNTIQVPDPTIAVPHPHRVRVVLGWAAVVLALAVAATVLVVALRSSGDAETGPHTGIVERGSITAIEHGATPSARPAAQASLTQRSITAVDRAAQRSGG